MKKWQTAIVSFLIIGMAGCQADNPAQEGRENDNHNPKFQEIDQSLDDDGTQEVNPPSQEIAKNLVEIAEEVPDVNDATAIVTMGYAVVGIDVDKDIDRTRVGSIKYSVAQALRKHRYGANAVVVADADTVERLNEMGNAIGEGRPVRGMLDELSEIVSRVVPQVPSDVLPGDRGEKGNPQNPDQQMPDEDKHKLEKQQNNQMKDGETNTDQKNRQKQNQ